MIPLAPSASIAPDSLAPSQARAIIRRHSKSFSLASLLLGPGLRDDAASLYAYCRRADDAVDLVPPERAPDAVSSLHAELDDVYAGRAVSDATLSTFQRLVFEKTIPRAYPEALLNGFRRDAEGKEYDTLGELIEYCWFVAGSVGAMMCHVLGVRRPRAVVHGVHLGMAMQLTNICRDVDEDWQRGRLYLPRELAPGLECMRASRRFPRSLLGVTGRAVRRLLSEADVLYASGDLGLPYLSFRSRLAVATARRVYAAIGDRILAQHADVLGGRAVVPGPLKLWHAAAAGASSVRLSLRAPRFEPAVLERPLRYPEDVLPV